MDLGQAEDMAGAMNGGGEDGQQDAAYEGGQGEGEDMATGEAAYNQAWAEEHGLQLIGGNNRTVRQLQTRRRCMDMLL